MASDLADAAGGVEEDRVGPVSVATHLKKRYRAGPPQVILLVRLTEYIHAAMRAARYEMMEDGRFFAVIPPCEGLWADGDTLESAREQLQDVLEDWILIKARHADTFPVIAGVDVNPRAAYAEAD